MTIKHTLFHGRHAALRHSGMPTRAAATPTTKTGLTSLRRLNRAVGDSATQQNYYFFIIIITYILCLTALHCSVASIAPLGDFFLGLFYGSG